MPPIGVLIGGVDFSDLSLTIQEATKDTAAVTMNWGNTVQTLLNFIIIAFAIFKVVKGMNNMKKKEEEAPKAPPEPSKEEVLLTEIRDALKNK
jgi:large conductance mechanosensitive channel